jgi:hypothetical protein
MPLFSLPQFTETEIKVFGPFTFKQLIIALSVGAFAFFIYIYLPKFIALPLALVFFVGGVALIVVRINDVPLYSVILQSLSVLFGPRVIVWGKRGKGASSIVEMEIKKIEKKEVSLKKSGALQDLIWKIKTK